VKGLLITFEGPEGSGKSTQTARLADRLREIRCPVVETREPGGTATGEAIRDILQHNMAGEPLFAETEALLFAASRAQLVRGVILPALERGVCVICDRFVDSSAAYQGYGRGLDVNRVLGINALAVDGLVPDVTILLDIDVVDGLARLGERNSSTSSARDRIEGESVGFHERVRKGYLRLGQEWPDRIKVIDGRPAADVVEREIWDAVHPLLEKR